VILVKVKVKTEHYIYPHSSRQMIAKNQAVQELRKKLKKSHPKKRSCHS